MRSSPRIPTYVHALLFLTLLGGLASAQEKSNASERHELQKGQVVASVRSVDKPEQSYSLYVPKNYAPSQRWPIIYAFDPGARGQTPVELMKEAAETYGYLVAGSNNARNGSWPIERDAAQEMWNDTHGWLSIDDKRVYFAGFSGGARVSTQLAQMCKCVRGVFLNGAGFPLDSPPSPKSMFPVFAAAGMSDLNYGELAELDPQLEAMGFRHFFQRFEGWHQWAPAELWQQALAWAALLEMKDGLRERDQSFVSAELARASERLRKRQETGELYFGWEETRSTIALFDGLTDTLALKDQLAAFAKNPAVRAGSKQEKSDFEKQQALEDAILSILESMRVGGGDQPSLAADASMRISQLRNDARNQHQLKDRRVSERALGGVFVSAMETGTSILERGDAHTAARFFEIGSIAAPDSTWPHFSLAKCHATMGDRKALLLDLKRARDAGATAADLADFVKTDPKTAPLLDTPEYRNLLTGK